MSKILPTRCDDSKVAMAMDATSYPHCVWADGKSIKYSRFYGEEWRLVAGTAVVTTSQNNVSVSKHCIGFDDYGNCFFAFMDGSDLKLTRWSGITWVTDTVWAGVQEQDPLAWSVAWNGFPIVVVITSSSGTKTIWATDKSSGSWGTPNGLPIPPQDDGQVELKVAKAGDWAYMFWNGREISSGTAWIGHAAWSFVSEEWKASPTKKIAMSAFDGEIASIDFTTSREV